MAFDPCIGEIILFEGTNPTGALQDTWAFTGTTWNNVSQNSAPGSRFGAFLSFDPSTGQLILFGGGNGSAFFTDTWEFNAAAGTWKQLSFSTPGPQGSIGTSLAFDSCNGQLILFGGANNGQIFNQTWGLTLVRKIIPPMVMRPTVTTDAASNVTTTSATLNGTVNPHESPTTFMFEYGLTPSYGTSTPLAFAGSGTSPISVSADINGLYPSTTYHFRIVASNAGGTSNGNDQTFTTLPAPVDNLRGKQVWNRFATQTDIVNIIKWQAPPAGSIPIVEYKVFRDAYLTKLAAIIPANQELRFVDHDRKRRKHYTYYVVAINQLGVSSIPVSVTVEPKLK